MKIKLIFLLLVLTLNSFSQEESSSIYHSISFFKQGLKKFKDNQLEFSYFIAKASIENNTQKRLGKTNLEYCIKNYKQNRYFREIDLKKLKEE